MAPHPPTLLEPLLQQLQQEQRSADGKILVEAFSIAERLYGERRHWTGELLLEHALGVLGILLPFHPDKDTIIACMLQHVLHTKQMTLSDIEEHWGSAVQSLVSGVHLLSHVSTRASRYSIDDLRLMLLSVSEDMRILLLTLCKRCYALEHIDALPPAERRRLCRDALNLFAPVSARLGIHTLKQRLEQRAFPVVYPHDAELISEQLAHLHERFGFFLPEASSLLTHELAAHGITATVEGREKHSYSIFAKMRTKGFSQIEKLHDLFALRVIVQNEEDCYRALGLLHRMGRPVANRFKDYIAFPKPNGYQSLHTTIAKLPGVPDGVFTEVQVRTALMHREAEFGIAAHWSYKEGGSTEQVLKRVQLHQVLTAQQSVEGIGKGPALADHIFVLTPKGDIVELPEGASPLDFAFQIHTHLGLSFRAARVNGRIVPLDYELENGDVIEILTHRVPKPSSEWLQLLKMASSRSRLKRYLYSLNRSLYITRGRSVLNEELRKYRLSSLDVDLSVMRSVGGKNLSFAEREDILMKIGQGSEKAGAVLSQIDGLKLVTSAPKPTRRTSRALRNLSPIEVEGGLPMPVRFAKCCKPDQASRAAVTGFITRSGEVTVHREGCRMLRQSNPERKVEVRWRDEGDRRDESH